MKDKELNLVVYYESESESYRKNERMRKSRITDLN